MKRNKNMGVTLIEVLMIVAIMGVMGAYAFNTFFTEIRSANLRSAATDIKTDFERARSEARRYNKNVAIALATDKLSYTITRTGTTAINKVLPTGTTLEYQAGENFIFTAPHSELNQVGATWPELKLTRDNKILYIKFVGTTGKVILSVQP